jgi:hypothetical protein
MQRRRFGHSGLDVPGLADWTYDCVGADWQGLIR